MPNHASSSLDLVVTMSCSLTLQPLSDHCPVIPLQMLEVWLCQWPSLTGMKHCTPHIRAVNMATSSRWFSYVLWLKVHNHLLLRARLLGSKRKLPPLACQIRPGLPSVVCHSKNMQCPGTVYICSQVLCQALEPTAFLVHPVLAAVAKNVIAAHSSVTRRCVETFLNSAGGPGPYHRS